MAEDMNKLGNGEERVDIVALMNRRYEKMSKSHKKIATYILDHYDQAVFMTAAQLGKEVEISESTVVRFASGLGFEGYPEFQRALEGWVKNEWNRYLALIRGGAKKTLIPAYRDMDPYDLPEEFSHLQAQDMGKLGFMQDLVRGVKKIAGAEKQVVVETVKSTVDTAALLQRVQM
jgi:DNA-binding MurR/RpiR family transcriptional regulator